MAIEQMYRWPAYKLLDQIKTLSQHDRFQPVVDLHFVQNMLNVVANRRSADAHHGSNFGSTFSVLQ